MPHLSKQLIDENSQNSLPSTFASVVRPLLCHFKNGRGCIFVWKEENQQVLKVHLQTQRFIAVPVKENGRDDTRSTLGLLQRDWDLLQRLHY